MEEGKEIIRIQCPFIFAFVENGVKSCVYMDNGYCKDVECCPGNGDAWCNERVEESISFITILEEYLEKRRQKKEK